MAPIKKSGVSIAWDDDFENLLEFAEEYDVVVDYSCRAGSCDTCKTRILSGTIGYAPEPVERPADGFALLCCAVPQGDVEVDV